MENKPYEVTLYIPSYSKDDKGMIHKDKITLTNDFSYEDLIKALRSCGFFVDGLTKENITGLHITRKFKILVTMKYERTIQPTKGTFL